MARIEINTENNLIPDQRQSAGDEGSPNSPYTAEGNIHPDYLPNTGQLIAQGYEAGFAEIHPANKHRDSHLERQRRQKEVVRDAALLARSALRTNVIVDAKTGVVLTPGEQEDIATRRHDGVHV